MQKLIVTADDYGMCDVVDKAIDAGIANGIITTTNVMLNMETLHNAADLRERYPHISVGIHWNVTTGKPISKPEQIPTLVDDKGMFWPIDVFKKKYSKGKISPADLEKELEAQYALFEKSCGKADYWNTHENSSLHTKSFKVFEKVAKKHNIMATRTFQRVYFDKFGLSIKTEAREFLVKNFFQLWFQKIRKTFVMPTARIVSFDRLSKTEGDVLLKAIKKDGRDFIEVVFHPATIADSPYFGNISTERVKEYQFVSSQLVYQKYKENDIEFVTYKDISMSNCAKKCWGKA
ncbi:MAG: ChbG/HpnK family deacetylase [Ruminococcaceae bacterium]|nr:ChbG/HpnK family deacetylase [Oscillospiraceae bacterium]